MTAGAERGREPDSELVSIIMPTYNCGAFIGETIASVQAQTHSHWELLVVDDCSTDDTAEGGARLCCSLGSCGRRPEDTEEGRREGGGILRAVDPAVLHEDGHVASGEMKCVGDPPFLAQYGTRLIGEAVAIYIMYRGGGGGEV